MSDIRRAAIAGLRAGDVFKARRSFTRDEVERFASISKDYNPVHFDPRFARARGFDGLICHGLHVASVATEIGGQLGWLASGLTVRFRKPVYVGDTVECRLVVREVGPDGRATADVVFSNQRGEVVMSAEMTGIVAGAKEREVMATMVAENDPTNPLR